jgi:hypothetical protein
MVWAPESAREHPLLADWSKEEFAVTSWLYKHQPLSESATVLMMGRVADRQPHEPVTWINKTKHGGRVFYTMLGHPDEFELPAFQKLLRRGIDWAAGIEANANDSEAASDATPLPDWVTMPVPGVWDGTHDGKLDKYDGYAWYRVGVAIPADWKGADLSLFVEKFDNVHEAWFNGQRLGIAGSFPPEYRSGLEESNRYKIEPAIVRPGETNVLALRVFDHDGKAGFKGTAPALFNERMAIDLAGPWQFRTGDDPEWAKLPADEKDLGGATFTRVDLAADIEPRFTTLLKEVGGLNPAEALAKFRVADDLAWDQVLAEPTVRQPLQISFDERGRMWVVQYLQYPHPSRLEDGQPRQLLAGRLRPRSARAAKPLPRQG